MSFQEWSQEIARQRAEERYKPNPNTFIVSSRSSVLPNIINDYIMESLKYSEEQLKMKEYLFGAPKYVVSGDYIPFEWLKYNPNLGLVQPYCKIELNNEKEKENMDAKRCDRCGKLYDTEERQNYISSYMPGKYVSRYEKENYTDAKIREIHTSSIRIIYHGNNSSVDLCPECREKLKNFFESGKDDPVDVAVREMNNVIKKAEE